MKNVHQTPYKWLVQLIRMGKSTRQMWVKVVMTFFPGVGQEKYRDNLDIDPIFDLC